MNKVLPDENLLKAPESFTRTQIEYNYRITSMLVLSTIFASFGGFQFGYQFGVTGGITLMPDFLIEFFPVVAENVGINLAMHKDPTCQFVNNTLDLYTGITYIGGMISTVVAGFLSRRRGRKSTIFIAGLLMIIGSIVQTFSYRLPQLLIGRLIVGFGVGFSNQVIPMYLSEIAPSKYRAAFTFSFMLYSAIGIFCAQVINWRVSQMDIGWRISTGIYLGPAVILSAAGLFLPETPNSLIERGFDEIGFQLLKQLRGVDDVEYEFLDIKTAGDRSAHISNPWPVLFSRRNLPQVIVMILVPTFQKLILFDVLILYSPQYFQSIGWDVDTSLLTAVIMGSVDIVSCVIGIILCDRVGRKILLTVGSIVMLAISTAVTAIASTFRRGIPITDSVKQFLIATLCIYTSAFYWSWGPIGYLIPSEIQTLETRSLGTSISVFFNFAIQFLIAQVVPYIYCKIGQKIFIIQICATFIMIWFSTFFMVETRKQPIEKVYKQFKNHWFWSKLY